MTDFDNPNSLENSKELKVLALIFIILAVLTIGFKTYNYYNTKLIHNTTKDIYDHPLKVSNAAMNIKLHIYKIHRDMKDIVLSTSNSEIERLLKDIDSYENIIYGNFNIIEKNILGEEGLKLEVKARHLFSSWKPIRNKVVVLIKKGKNDDAVDITKGMGAKHVIKLEKAVNSLYRYARNKADKFQLQSLYLFNNLERFEILSGIILILLFSVLTFYTVRRMYRYMQNNKKLNNQLLLKNLAFKYSVSADILFDKNGKLIDTNDAFKDIWGHSSTNKVFFQDLIERKEDAENIISFLKSSNLWEGEFKAIKKDGIVFEGYGLGNGIKNSFNETVCYYFTILDITQRKKDERELQRSEKRFKTLISNLPGMAYRCKNEKNWTMEFLSEGCRSLTGYPPDSIIHNNIRNFNSLIHEDDREGVWGKVQEALLENKHFIIDYRIITAKGEEKWIIEHGNGIYNEKGEATHIEGVILDNDTRKRTEQFLIDSESKYRSLFEHSFISIWNEDLSAVYQKIQKLGSKNIIDIKKYLKSNPDLVLDMASSIKVNHVNKATLNLFKAQNEISFLKNISTSFGDDALDIFIDELCAIWDGKRHFLSEAKFKTHEGEQFDAIISFRIPTLVDDFKNIPVSIMDISDRKNMEKKLNFNKNYLEKMFEIIPNLLITTINGKVDTVNDAMIQFSKKASIEDFKNSYQNICELFVHGEQKSEDEYIKWIEKLIKNPSSIHKVTMLKDNKPYKFLVKAKPLFIDDHDRNLIIFTDITEIEKAYTILKQQEEIIISQSRHAAMGEMISMIAHQWRQPISVISMAANNILVDIDLNDLDNDILKDTADEIVEQTVELSKTIDDFKDFFKPDKKAETLYIKDVLDNAFNVVRKSIENNNIKINLDINNNKKITTYSRELMQVFINILKNAKDILIEKRIKNSTIDISVNDMKNSIKISISDNGGGIPLEIMDKIFEPYFSTKSEKSGTGLGLYMSKEIIEKHLQGTIKVRNTLLGASFDIEIPYKLGDAKKQT